MPGRACSSRPGMRAFPMGTFPGVAPARPPEHNRMGNRAPGSGNPDGRPPMVESNQHPIRLRLAFGTVFWSTVAVTFFVRQLALLSFIRRRLRWLGHSKRVVFFLYQSPKSLYLAFA